MRRYSNTKLLFSHLLILFVLPGNSKQLRDYINCHVYSKPPFRAKGLMCPHLSLDIKTSSGEQPVTCT
jgi:hypothetical protein